MRHPYRRSRLPRLLASTSRPRCSHSPATAQTETASGGAESRDLPLSALSASDTICSSGFGVTAICPTNGRSCAAISNNEADTPVANSPSQVGEIYEVMHINERDGYYALSGLGRFTMTRFKLVSGADAGYWLSSRRRSPVGEGPNP